MTTEDTDRYMFQFVLNRWDEFSHNIGHMMKQGFDSEMHQGWAMCDRKTVIIMSVFETFNYVIGLPITV